jgi:AraC-like DNA-binding protein
MDALTFSTRSFATRDQARVWAEWFQPTFDMHFETEEQAGFAAEYSVWNVGDISIGLATGPGTRPSRTADHLRRSPIDHWVLSYCRDRPTTISTNGKDVSADAGVPFLWSLGYAMDGRNSSAPRLQVYLPRDSFKDMTTMLDMAVGSALDTQRGQLLADYLMLLKRNLPHLSAEDAARLPAAIQAMLGVCLAPTPDAMAAASRQIQLTFMERVREVVRRNLRSPSLGPDRLCREAGLSRSQLYRVLEHAGGVTNYIKRCRLAESMALLSDVSNGDAINKVAELLCFSDASTFSRAFRQEFGVSPGDVRSAALSGMAIEPAPASKLLPKGYSFSSFLGG